MHYIYTATETYNPLLRLLYLYYYYYYYFCGSLPLESLQSSLDEKTPVAKMLSLHTTPL